jgi:hypothetical protein
MGDVQAPLEPAKGLLHEQQMELLPLSGLARSPGGQLPPNPAEDNLQPIMTGKKKSNSTNMWVTTVCGFLTGNKSGYAACS